MIASDGDIQEGVTSEASSLAGHRNWATSWWSTTRTTSPSKTTPTSLSPKTSSSAIKRTAGTPSAWTGPRQATTSRTSQELYAALLEAKAETSKPSIISLRTIIGYPAPKKQNTGKIHGSALGAEEVAAVKTVLGFDPAKSFDVDEEVLAHARKVRLGPRCGGPTGSGTKHSSARQSANPEGAALLERIEPGSFLRTFTPFFPCSKPARTFPPVRRRARS